MAREMNVLNMPYIWHIYYIDQFEVTMERYQIFLDETYHEFPPLWDDGAAFEEAKDWPAVDMAWASAKTYCK